MKIEDSYNSYNLDILTKINLLMSNINLSSYDNIKNNEYDDYDEHNQLIQEVKKIIKDDNKIEIIKTLNFDELLHYSLLLKENNFEDADYLLDHYS